MSNSSVSSSTVTPLTPFKTHPPMREKMETAIKQARQFPVMEKPVEEKKEEKEPRMIVRATYTVSNEFRIPRGIDLEDKEQVESWGIKWDMMEIYLQNGKTIKIDPTYSIQDGHDFKRPDETEIDEDEEEELCSNDCGNLMDTEDFTCVNCNKNSWCRTCEPECQDMKYVKERGWLCGKCFEK